ncbi:MAG: radical SAM protein [Pseudomonadota bacterium]
MSDQRARRPLIVPIFIPNQGCPHLCIFCQQEKITDQSSRPVNGRRVREILEEAVGSPGFKGEGRKEIAFYGGSFTNLSMDRISELLEAAAPYLSQGLFEAIRVSARPDAMDEGCLELMRRRGVDTVELGVQSMDDRVLELSRRGHRAGDTVRAVQVLRKKGFKVGIQLMPGLPGDGEDIFRETVRKVIDLRPDMARLYPAIVIKGTALALLYEENRFLPLTLERAVGICSESCVMLEREGIPVIRIGLMSSPSLLEEGQIVAGPWHPSFGFLVRSDIHQKRIRRFLPRPGEAGSIRLRVPFREIPLVRGYKNRGLILIERITGAEVRGVFGDETVPPGRAAFDRLS